MSTLNTSYNFPLTVDEREMLLEKAKTNILVIKYVKKDIEKHKEREKLIKNYLEERAWGKKLQALENKLNDFEKELQEVIDKAPELFI